MDGRSSKGMVGCFHGNIENDNLTMLTPREKRQYQALAEKLRGPTIKITGRTLAIGRQAIDLPQLPVKSSITQGIF